LPLVGAAFDIDADRLRIREAFVVFYDAGGRQSHLGPHKDGTLLSCTISLNPPDGAADELPQAAAPYGDM
jgi:hypothetical protein